MSGTVAYLTKRFPRLSETFILDEILGLEAVGVPLRLYAIADPHEPVVQPDVARVLSTVTYLQNTSGRWARVKDARATASAHLHVFSHHTSAYLRVLWYIARKRRHRSSIKNFILAGKLARELERHATRHLHAAFAHGPASIAHFVHLLTGLPFSFSAHAKDIYVSAPDLLARKTRDATFALVCSESAQLALSELPGGDPAKVILAYHGVDTQRFHQSERHDALPETPRIIAVGRLVEKKGYPTLFGALDLLHREGVDFRCTVVGSGVLHSPLASLVDQLALSEHVEFLGALTHQDVAAHIAQADIFVQSSVVLANGDRDGVPNSLLEAMASGLAIVASDVAGIPEVLTRGSGILVPPGDAPALASALGDLCRDEMARHQLGAVARAHVTAHFDRVECASRIAPLFGVGAPVDVTIKGPGALRPLTDSGSSS